MNSFIRPLVLCVAVMIFPVVSRAQVSMPAVPAATGLSGVELSDGLKAGLGSALESGLGKLIKPDGLKVSPPKVLATLEKNAGQSDASGGLSAALSAAAAKIAPQAATLMRDVFKNVKIDDAKAVLAGGPGAGTAFLRKSMEAPLREKLLPLVKEATASSGVAAKAKELLAAAGPFAAMGGSKAAADIDGYLCDQVIGTSFQFLGKEEAAMRANPFLLKNPLAQKVFGLFEK